jgi:methionyl-tRNA synthetase
MKDQIEFKEFIEIESKLEIKVGKVISVEDVPKSSKLIKLEVDFGDEVRTCVTNIKSHLNMNQLDYPLIDISFLFVTNLKPVTMMGIESTVMILPGEIESEKMITVNSQSGTKLM